MQQKRNLVIGVCLLALLAVYFVVERSFQRTALAQAQSGEQVPIYEVDPLWPKTPLPNNWVLGNVIGAAGETPAITSGSFTARRPLRPMKSPWPKNPRRPAWSAACLPRPSWSSIKRAIW